MSLDDNLFAMSPHATLTLDILPGGVPTLLIDNFYERPDDIRQAALNLQFETPDYPYPGKLAVLRQPVPSLGPAIRHVLGIVNNQYLPKVPLAADGSRIAAFRSVYTDFALIDVHPSELSAAQRIPHTDPVPIFGLVYLNRAERGGTLFFQQKADVPENPEGEGYVTNSSREFELCGRIEGRFNRLAIYPGFVPHSGEIAGDWILGDERFTAPRLTQRLVFMP